MAEVDIYSDLPDDNTSHYFEKLSTELTRLRELSQTLEIKYQKELALRVKLEEKLAIMKKNQNLFYVTVKCEIKRKDETIQNLQKEIDDILLRKETDNLSIKILEEKKQALMRELSKTESRSPRPCKSRYKEEGRRSRDYDHHLRSHKSRPIHRTSSNSFSERSLEYGRSRHSWKDHRDRSWDRRDRKREKEHRAIDQRKEEIKRKKTSMEKVVKNDREEERTSGKSEIPTCGKRGTSDQKSVIILKKSCSEGRREMVKETVLVKEEKSQSVEESGNNEMKTGLVLLAVKEPITQKGDSKMECCLDQNRNPAISKDKNPESNDRGIIVDFAAPKPYNFTRQLYKTPIKECFTNALPNNKWRLFEVSPLAETPDFIKIKYKTPPNDDDVPHIKVSPVHAVASPAGNIEKVTHSRENTASIVKNVPSNPMKIIQKKKAPKMVQHVTNVANLEPELPKENASVGFVKSEQKVMNLEPECVPKPKTAQEGANMQVQASLDPKFTHHIAVNNCVRIKKKISYSITR